ncbi:hypothetical protein AX17_006836 [Amanita inopinata Kibby_2008]|nr:hypothetical protein AX17_006836 [Amanita inopinata Kibby_2008]
MARQVDLVMTFIATGKTTISQSQTRREALHSQQQYARLIETLTYSGLHAVGRRGESLGHLLIFISCPQKLLDALVKRERHSDFLSGLPVTPLSPGATIGSLSPADRIRLVCSYITSTPMDGGLGISPDAPDWDCVESMLPLHDREFNETWTKSWKPQQMATVSIGTIRDEFGDSVAYYYAFLSAYTYFLIFPASLGLIAYFFLEPYSPFYSILTCIWSIVFVEWWRVHERILSLRFGTRGSFRVEKRRVQYKPGLSWWHKDLRALASIPVILFFAGILAVLLTGIFVLEAFVTRLYEGPGKQIITFAPTILFAALVPRVLAIYHALAKRLTAWENHAHQSSYTASLTLKTFALGAIVAYLGLGLSAFIYVPFGEGLMYCVQMWLFNGTTNGRFKWPLPFGLNMRLWGRMPWNATAVGTAENVSIKVSGPDPSGGLWDMDVHRARQKLDPSRLKSQMFAFTVTNQVVGTFMEVGMPYILRALSNFRKNGKGKTASTPSTPGGKMKSGGSGFTNSSLNASSVVSASGTQASGTASPIIKKRVVFEDEKERGGIEEREFLDRVRAEAALPPYDLFVDYSEMATQFGYVAVWSTIWPLAPVMALVNNFFEIRSDAFKMTVHYRRPIPMRTDTIGPWLDALTFLTWLAALSNASLVYLFSPMSERFFSSTAVLEKAHKGLFAAVGSESASFNAGEDVGSAGPGGSSTSTMEVLLMRALLIALISSHGYILLRALVSRIVEQIWWRERSEVRQRENEEMGVRERFLKGLGAEKDVTGWEGESRDDVHDEGGREETATRVPREDVLQGFWDHDDGVEEIERISKES